jgi:hypothetical protein
MPVMSLNDRIMKRVRGRGRGAVFTAHDFLDLGSRANVDQVLSRLAADATFRRLDRGVYDWPQVSSRFGAVLPDLHTVAMAVGRANNARVQIDGPLAANVLGLSLQVPAQAAFLTDGPSRKVKVGKRSVVLRHASPKSLVAPGSQAGTIFQAMRYLGPSAVGDVVDRVGASLGAADRRRLSRAAATAPDWMRPALAKLAMDRPSRAESA